MDISQNYQPEEEGAARAKVRVNLRRKGKPKGATPVSTPKPGPLLLPGKLSGWQAMNSHAWNAERFVAFVTRELAG